MTNHNSHLRDRLSGGLFLSALMGITDGEFCAERSRGAKMVQLGAFLAEPEASADERRNSRSFLPEDPGCWVEFFREQCICITQVSPVLTCLNLAALKAEWAVRASAAFIEAGGDMVELNVHGGYSRYLEQGRLRAMILPEHRGELFRWVRAIIEQHVPLIVKFHGGYERRHLYDVLRCLENEALLGIHLNVRDSETKQPDLELVRTVKSESALFLLASGYARRASDVFSLFDAGADMVGVGDPVRGDPEYISKLAQQIHSA